MAPGAWMSILVLGVGVEERVAAEESAVRELAEAAWCCAFRAILHLVLRFEAPHTQVVSVDCVPFLFRGCVCKCAAVYGIVPVKSFVIHTPLTGVGDCSCLRVVPTP